MKKPVRDDLFHGKRDDGQDTSEYIKVRKRKHAGGVGGVKIVQVIDRPARASE